ncbi:MAG TPA: ABC transporter permease [Polyangia bacterium]|jgi:phospholipid/cholesterol/gamma-HCH transport system permease protein
MEPRVATVARLPDGALELRLGGRWAMARGMPSPELVARELEAVPPPVRLAFDTRALEGWDSSLVAFLRQVVEWCGGRGVAVDRHGLPDSLNRLIGLAEAVHPAPTRPPAEPRALLARVGDAAARAASGATRLLGFMGEVALVLGRFVVGRARYRRIDLAVELQEAGARALPIVTVVSFLLGMIMAFVGAITLRSFGAAIYVANVVTVGMVRELGPIMTAIVMAGRTGSAYAAQLGTMKVTQEVEALVTMGLEPLDFLVLPRMLALSLMMPLLCVYADFVAMFAGGLVATAMLDLNPVQYVRQSQGAVTLTVFLLGTAKSLVFGVIVAVAGCDRGMRAGKSAAAVGNAATAAVVTSIVWIIAADGLFAVLFNLWGI